jgi:peptidoglycan/LPS O-acetylase OafA/YrhL
MRSGSASTFRLTVASVLLDALRGVAALLVCVGHWRYFLFVDYPQIVEHRGWFYLPYLMCTMGHQAVIVFFVLSGYLVGGHVLRALDTSRWSWRSYLVHRGTRLWIVLLPALVLGGLLDFAAIRLNLAPALYEGLVRNHITFDVHATLTWKALLGNCLFLQTITTPAFGSNGALWSLANEFWYYLMFPLGLLAVRGHGSVLKRVVMGLVCMGMLYGVGRGIALLFPVWLLGALLAILPSWRTAAWMRWLALAVYCPFFAAVSRGGITGRFPPDYALGLATLGLLYVLLGAHEPATGRWYERPSRTMAGFSYTLYLVHTPMLMLLTALLVGDSRWWPNVRHTTIGLGVLAFVVGYAYLVARMTEFRTDEVRNWLLRRLPERAGSTTLAQ